MESLDLEGKEKRYRPRGGEGIEGWLRELEAGRTVFKSLPPASLYMTSADVLEKGERDESRVMELVEHFGLRVAVEEDEREEWLAGEHVHWGDEAVLAGNYFGDDPSDAVVVQ